MSSDERGGLIDVSRTTYCCLSVDNKTMQLRVSKD